MLPVDDSKKKLTGQEWKQPDFELGSSQWFGSVKEAPSAADSPSPPKEEKPSLSPPTIAGRLERFPSIFSTPKENGATPLRDRLNDSIDNATSALSWWKPRFLLGLICGLSAGLVLPWLVKKSLSSGSSVVRTISDLRALSSRLDAIQQSSKLGSSLDNPVESPLTPKEKR